MKQSDTDPGTTTPDSLSAGSGPPSAGPPSGPGPSPGPGPGPAEPVPLERLEAQICELAGHLAAATCRFLVLVGDFDARRGWATWEMNSCAQWLAWKCQLSPGTTREHVRVARADDATARIGRRLTWRFHDDGSLAGTFRLPPLAGAVLLQALRAADITPDTIIPAWYGERLNLHDAIYICFANADYQARHRDDKDQHGHEPPDQDSETPEPPSYSSTPVDLITAVHNICERQRLN